MNSGIKDSFQYNLLSITNIYIICKELDDIKADLDSVFLDAKIAWQTISIWLKNRRTYMSVNLYWRVAPSSHQKTAVEIGHQLKNRK